MNFESKLFKLAGFIKKIATEYYVLEQGTSIQEVIDNWKKGMKPYDDSYPIYYSPDELWEHREYTWTRSTARSGHAINFKENLSGENKWDKLKEELETNGWDPNNQLIFYIGKDGTTKIGEGNHRLAIAKEIGLEEVPVRFIFSHGSIEKNEQFPKAEKKISDPIEEKSYKTTAGVLSKVLFGGEDKMNKGLYPGTSYRLREIPIDAPIQLVQRRHQLVVRDEEDGWIADRFGPVLGARDSKKVRNYLDSIKEEVKETEEEIDEEKERDVDEIMKLMGL